MCLNYSLCSSIAVFVDKKSPVLQQDFSNVVSKNELSYQMDLRYK